MGNDGTLFGEYGATLKPATYNHTIEGLSAADTVQMEVNELNGLINSCVDGDGANQHAQPLGQNCGTFLNKQTLTPMGLDKNSLFCARLVGTPVSVIVTSMLTAPAGTGGETGFVICAQFNTKEKHQDAAGNDLGTLQSMQTVVDQVKFMKNYLLSVGMGKPAVEVTYDEENA